MTISDINVGAALERGRQPLKEDCTVSPTLRSAIDVLMLLVKQLTDRLAISYLGRQVSPAYRVHPA